MDVNEIYESFTQLFFPLNIGNPIIVIVIGTVAVIIIIAMTILVGCLLTKHAKGQRAVRVYIYIYIMRLYFYLFGEEIMRIYVKV